MYGSSAVGVEDEPGSRDDVGIEEVARVDNDAALDEVAHAIPVETTELRPFCEDDERLDALGCRVGVIDDTDRFDSRIVLSGLNAGVVGNEVRSCLVQQICDCESR
jgi:hypothetical protein